MNQNKKKNLKVIIPVISFSAAMLIVAFILLTVYILKKRNTPEKVVQSVSFNVNTNTSNGKKYNNGIFSFLDTDEITFTKGDFNVIINYSDSSFESTNNYTIEVKKTDEIPSSVEVRFNEEFFREFTITVRDTSGASIDLGIFKDLKEIPEISSIEHAFKYNRELRWNEEFIDAGSLFVLNDNTTLNQLLRENKASVIHSYGSLLFNSPNLIIDGNYNFYSITVTAKEGYEFSYNEEKFDTFRLMFTIKRKIIALPELTSETIFEYAYDEDTLESVKQGLTFDYKGRDNIISRPTTESEIGSYTTTLSITDSNKYAFLIGGVEKSTTQEYSYSIIKKKLDINEFKITDQAHFDLNSNTYRYKYTGEHIIPDSNISNSVRKLLNISDGAINASDNIQTLTISFKDLDTYIDTNSKIYLKNFVWSNGSRIEVKEYSLSYYVDKADAFIPDNVKNNLSLRNLKYREGLSLDLYSLSSNTKDESWFSESSFDLLNSNNISLSAFSFHSSSTAIGIGTNNLIVVYCPDTSNYNPLEMTLISNVTKGIVNITYSFNSDTKQLAFVKDVSSAELNVSNKYYIVNPDESTGSEVSDLTNVGRYRLISSLEENYYYDFYYENTIVTSITYDFTVPKTVLILGYNASDCWSNVTATNLDRVTKTNPLENEWGLADVYDTVPNLYGITFDTTKLGRRITESHLNILDYLDFSSVSVKYKYLITDLNNNGTHDTDEPDDEWHEYTGTPIEHPFYVVFEVSVSYDYKSGINPNNYMILNDFGEDEETTKSIKLYFRVYPSIVEVELEDSAQGNYIGFDPSDTFSYHTYDDQKYPEYIIKNPMFYTLTLVETDSGTMTIIYPTDSGTYKAVQRLYLKELFTGENTKVRLTRNGVQDGELITPDKNNGGLFYESQIQEYTILPNP